ncbi:hypothetical protein HDK90DRAFT_468340 [Phyllosticta capitalensis]|uniref:Uncharacterized protein n=1 Tax=Phyllosticta capitalensis TaxID=121624 RepID=A0ABR1YFM7_9PEZI
MCQGSKRASLMGKFWTAGGRTEGAGGSEELLLFRRVMMRGKWPLSSSALDTMNPSQFCAHLSGRSRKRERKSTKGQENPNRQIALPALLPPRPPIPSQQSCSPSTVPRTSPIPSPSPPKEPPHTTPSLTHPAATVIPIPHFQIALAITANAAAGAQSLAARHQQHAHQRRGERDDHVEDDEHDEGCLRVRRHGRLTFWFCNEASGVERSGGRNTAGP